MKSYLRISLFIFRISWLRCVYIFSVNFFFEICKRTKMPMLGYMEFYVNVLDSFIFCHENVAYLDILTHEHKQNAIGSWNEDSTKLGFKGILVILPLIWSHVDHHFLPWCVCHVGPTPIFLKPYFSVFSQFLPVALNHLTLSSFTVKTQPPPIVIQASSNTKTRSKAFLET